MKFTPTKIKMCKTYEQLSDNILNLYNKIRCIIQIHGQTGYVYTVIWIFGTHNYYGLNPWAREAINRYINRNINPNVYKCVVYTEDLISKVQDYE